jgi:hypothetical protein
MRHDKSISCSDWSFTVKVRNAMCVLCIAVITMLLQTFGGLHPNYLLTLVGHDKTDVANLVSTHAVGNEEQSITNPRQIS